MSVGTKLPSSPAARRIIQVVCLLVILGGTVLASRTSASTAGGCQRICATFCPNSMETYCKNVGCGESGSCESRACVLPGYQLAKTIRCASPGGGGSGGGDLY